MKRLTFGVASSPLLETQVLRQLAKNKQTEFPIASTVVKEAFYVDDCLIGANSVQEATTSGKTMPSFRNCWNETPVVVEQLQRSIVVNS